MRIKYLISVKFGVETEDPKKVRQEIIEVLLTHLPRKYDDFIVALEAENRQTGEIEELPPPKSRTDI